MKLLLTDHRFLKDGINILSELVTDVKIKLDSDKLEIVAMDPANVAMVVFRLLSSAFAEYEVGSMEVIAINLDSLKQILNRAKPTDKVSLELDEEKNKLKVVLKGDSKRIFNIGLIDIHEKDQKIPDLKFVGSVEMSSSVFNEAVDDMGVVSDSVSLVLGKNSFSMESMGNVNDAQFEVKSNDETKIVLEGDNETIRSKYSTSYLKKIIRASKLTDKVFLKFGHDYPLQVEYKVMDKLYLMTFLAPRVSND